MDNSTGSLSGGIPIGSGMRVLSGKDLMEEASKMPTREFDAGHGVKVVRQGMMIKIVGGENLSPHATMAAMRASQMGGDAGRAMFDTYAKNNPDHFDGSQTFDAIMKKANAPHPQPPVASTSAATSEAGRSGIYKSGGNGAELKGTPAGDFLEALHNSAIYGGDGDDTLKGGIGSKLFGGAGDDNLTGRARSELYGGGGNDTLTAGGSSVLNGGEGDDVLTSFNHSTLNGDEGNDVLSAYNSSKISGGDGNDRLSAYHGSSFDGGPGDDSIAGYNDSVVVDENGDNHVSTYRDSTIYTGSGDDWINAYSGATVRAGHGNNMISTYGNSSIISGDDADMIEVGVNSLVVSGGGDDLVSAGSGSTVNAGAGDDRVTLKGDSIYHYARGDGNDIIGGGGWGHAYRPTENLSSSVIAFDDGIAVGDLSFEAQGNDLLIGLGQGDSLTVRDYQRHGIPSITFGDGTTLRSQDVAEAVGPGDAYRPISQLMQNWHNAALADQNNKG